MAHDSEQSSEFSTTAAMPSSTTAPARRTSGWAIAALLCSLALCPPIALVGVLLAIRALVDVNANPGIRGRGLAWTAIVLAFAGMSGFGVFMWWWGGHVRPPLLYGPQEQLRQAMTGNAAGFKEGFIGEGKTASDSEVRAFISELTSRYGGFVGSQQKEGALAVNSPTFPDAMRITYEWQFTRATVDAEVDIELFADGLYPRFRFVVVRDAALGDVYYPPQAQQWLEQEAQDAEEAADAVTTQNAVGDELDTE